MTSPAAGSATSTTGQHDPWAKALAYAQHSGLANADAEAFADDYAGYVEDRATEPRYPDTPVLEPSDYAWW